MKRDKKYIKMIQIQDPIQIRQEQTTNACKINKKSKKPNQIIYAKIQVYSNGQNVRDVITQKRSDETTCNFNKTKKP